MSSKRAASMAQIQQATATTDAMKKASTPDDAVAAFLGQPVQAVGAPGTQPKPAQITASSTVAGQKDTDTAEVVDVSFIGDAAGHLYAITTSGIKRIKTRLEGVPIPGGLAVPLVILIILFLLLLPVNGHTRIMWLWLALTNNAEIGGPLVPPTALVPPTGAAGTTYNTGSPTTNPNQQGTTSSSSSSPQISIATATKKNTTVTTNKSKNTPNKTKTGGGPGPYETGLIDPTAPSVQLSYSILMGKYNGYD